MKTESSYNFQQSLLTREVFIIDHMYKDNASIEEFS